MLLDFFDGVLSNVLDSVKSKIVVLFHIDTVENGVTLVKSKELVFSSFGVVFHSGVVVVVVGDEMVGFGVE